MLQFCSVSNSPLTDNTFRNPFEPFQIKWEVYFSKEQCLLVFIVLNMLLHASAYEYVTDGRLCEVGAIGGGIRIVRLWGLYTSV